MNSTNSSRVSTKEIEKKGRGGGVGGGGRGLMWQVNRRYFNYVGTHLARFNLIKNYMFAPRFGES